MLFRGKSVVPTSPVGSSVPKFELTEDPPLAAVGLSLDAGLKSSELLVPASDARDQSGDRPRRAPPPPPRAAGQAGPEGRRTARDGARPDEGRSIAQALR